jgi:hypothetical protein
VIAWVALGVVNSLTPNFHDTLFRREHMDFFRVHLPLDVATREIAQRAQPDDRVAFESPVHSWAVAGSFDYYMHPLPVRYTLLDQLPGEDAAAYGEAARGFVGDATRVWLLEETAAPPSFRLAAFENVLDGFAPCEGENIDFDGGLRMALYSRAPACCAPPANPADAAFRFGNGIRINAVSPFPDAVNDALPLVLAWSIDADVPPETYSLALHVTDAAGELVAQADAGLPGAGVVCRLYTLDTQALPPGDYTVYAIVYAWESGARLVGAARDGATGDRLSLGAFRKE